ncbi:MAG: tryptophan-rich sensory protein [Synechococcales cyanobacterium K44_A2020_017]|nr:tryptophan-rich sensory protein [Synechococcales cyanobacterium K32_A2020_035]MBF2094289.1 tryptophan-rich sensory protein [Synechococcales cyanobacterium K44_A2020_017]
MPVQPTFIAKARPYATIVAIIGTFLVNAWSNIDPINGESIGAISNRVFGDVMIIPANYAFIIWGLIYLGLIAFGIYQLLPSQRSRSDLDPVRHALILSSVAQGVWVFLFLYRLFWGSMVAMAAILIALAYGYYCQRQTMTPSRRDRWLVNRPLSLYLGWISVATIVNGAIALYSTGWTELGLGMPAWTVIMLAVATLLGSVMAFLYRDAVFAGVLIWAFVAIAVRHADQGLVSPVAIAASVVLIAALGVARWKQVAPRSL